MNSNNRGFKSPLPPCPKCGRYSGRRMATTEAYERYLVICESCGVKTEPYSTQAAATRAWKRGAAK